MILDGAYVSLKNAVIKAERRVLKELGFCVHVKHPHKVSGGEGPGGVARQCAKRRSSLVTLGGI